MELATLIVAIVSALFSGISSYAAMLPFLRKKPAMAALADDLQRIEETLEGKEWLQKYAAATGAGISKGEPDIFKKHLLEWLANGRLILQGLMRKVVVRLIFLEAASVSLSSAIYLDIPNVVFPEWMGRLEIFDGGLMAAALVAPWIVKGLVNRSLLPAEREFIAGLRLLEDVYYETFVQPAMRAFNNEMRLFFKGHEVIQEQERQALLQQQRQPPQLQKKGP